jgi:hypothetical protein
VSDEPGRDDVRVRDDAERCDHAIDDEIRCVLVIGHDGLHEWRDPDTARTFEWG